MAEVRPSRGVSALESYYREHGESEYLRRVEAALTERSRTTQEIAAAAGVSLAYCSKALGYLAREGRAEHRRSHGRSRWSLPQ